MNHIYGPVTSRRLGTSLGVSITPHKYCMFNCVYCQLKSTSTFTLKRRVFVKPGIVLDELSELLSRNPLQGNINYVTISGSGEPLLHSKIQDIIEGIKRLTPIPVAVITNSALLMSAKVRSEVRSADLIVPSLDAFTQDLFEKIDRPCSARINIGAIIEGLIALRNEFHGKIWLEIMMVKGLNDNFEYMERFKEIIERIQPDKIHLNVPSRPPAELWVRIPSPARLKKIQSLLGSTCEILW